MPKNMELLTFASVGSVDDGKSTLIGRLLYDSDNVFLDQIDALKGKNVNSKEDFDLALLTDGLKDERAQGITIDVAYRYFSTPKRKFIIADSPGHEEYTRNAITALSNSDLSIILIDARHGILPQTKRHTFISSLMGIPRIIVAINKMDLVDYSEEVYERIKEEFHDFTQKLKFNSIKFVPISALNGDNVVTKSENMPWYNQETMLEYLENVDFSGDRNLVDFRFPVQGVIRPNLDYRGFTGKVASGSVSKGQEVVILPSETTSKIKKIDTYDAEIDMTFEGQSVTLLLEDEVDCSRGCMICRKDNIPHKSKSFTANICWMDPHNKLVEGKSYSFKHTTQTITGQISKIHYKIDVNTLHRDENSEVALNEIAKVQVKLQSPIFFDEYVNNRSTGSFIMIDEMSNNTVGAGMIKADCNTRKEETNSDNDNVVEQELSIARDEYETMLGQKGKLLWFTGLSGSGKSTIANGLSKQLFDDGKMVVMLDGDNVRHGLCKDLGFGDTDRKENIRRVGEVAKLMVEKGIVVICTLVSPFEEDRQAVKDLVGDDFVEIFVDCPIEECARRDVKGLYAKAKSGEIKNFTGIGSDYEAPKNPDLTLDTMRNTIDACVTKLYKLFK